MTIKRLEPTKANVAYLLEMLGDTDEKVFKSLRRKRIKGGRLASNCPINVYLRRRLAIDANDGILVSRDVISIQYNGEWDMVYTPYPVALFIRKYDNKSAYGELEG